MLRYNALGNGKSEAVAGDIAAGSVSAVKAEKQVFDFFFRETVSYTHLHGVG